MAGSTLNRWNFEIAKLAPTDEGAEHLAGILVELDTHEAPAQAHGDNAGRARAAERIEHGAAFR